MSSNTPVIKVEGVSKRFHIYNNRRDRVRQLGVNAKRLIGIEQPNHYHDFWALDNVNFEVSAGQTVGILGQNGSGKSTLLQIIAGTMEPTMGSVTTVGKVAALLELGSGFNPEFTGRENVYLNASLLGLTRAEVEDKFDFIAGFADVGDHLDQPVKTYSSGMMLRLAFAVQVAVETPVLIIDEALAVGDARFQRKCFRRLEELKSNGTTILFVSHATDMVRAFCDYGLVLEKGKTLYWGEARTATVKYLSTLFPDENKARTASAEGDDEQKPGTQRDAEGWLTIHPDQSEVHSFGVGGVTLEWLKIHGLDAPNIAVDGNEVRIRYRFSWNQEHLRDLVENEGYRNDITPSISLSDKQGNHIFGCNGFDYGLPVDCFAADHHVVEFKLTLPLLQPGEYFLTVAIALGTQAYHVQLKWYDALCAIRFMPARRNVYGVMRLDYHMELLE